LREDKKINAGDNGSEKKGLTQRSTGLAALKRGMMQERLTGKVRLV